MIGFLSGKVLSIQEGRVLLGVGGNRDSVGCVGYLIQVPSSGSYQALQEGKTAEFFIHTHVRENILDLIGFLTSLEKELFLSLLTVTGIGPKGALNILSKVEASTLIESILEDQKEILSETPGVGKKTAERIVVELGDRFRKKIQSFSLENGNIPSGMTATLRDAKGALVSLGYREQEIAKALKKIQNEGSGVKTEEVIKLALKELS